MDSAVFDTNILIEYSNGNMEAQRVVRTTPGRYISRTTWIEFLVGVPISARARFKSFLVHNFEVIECDEELSDYIIDIRREKRLKLPDATIYATAKSLRAPLVTLNSKDFDKNAHDVIIPY